ncbi:MAG TPA: glutamine--fructose-6-phosphate transaminase (isomerizing) [Candidatus Paceibacterota bacterium]|nr:glutamine--fructose-6-phosphate transaminase (isomerizing) [Candidatus Paceibacterota bacterium]
MCGIFAYTGTKEASTVLLDGLLSLEYRGYDSAGIFLPQSGIIKSAGAVSKLKEKIQPEFVGTSGIAHLRWATHGEPTESNAHPHGDCTGDVWIVHNGIIENFRELKEKLSAAGHTFKSDTDTEVLAHLVEEHLKNGESFTEAARSALNEVRGTYGIALQYRSEPQTIIAARMGAPVALGLGDDENFVASDATPILRHTKQVLYLEDGEMAVITPTSHLISKLDASLVNRIPETIDWSPEAAQKSGHEFFMMKEMMEEPDVIRNTIRGRLIVEQGLAKLGGLESVAGRLRDIKRLLIVGCGTASYAGYVGEYMIEEYAGIPVEVEIGSEFRYRKPLIDEHTAVLAISQSGETADTLEAIREGKRKGALTLGIVNTVGSTIARETDAGVYNHAGPEIGVASTKAFISQLTALALFTLYLGRERGMSVSMGTRIVEELQALPEKVQQILDNASKIQAIASKYKDARDFLYIGRKYNYPVAFEGALKLKEISYVHAEGCGAGEMKHGPLAMIDENFPTMAIVPSDSVYEKTLSNIQEIKARKGPVITIATEGNEDIKRLADDVIYIPKTLEMLTPILAVVPLQLFAYYIATNKGLNVDRPRNLAKSVTVE